MEQTPCERVPVMGRITARGLALPHLPPWGGVPSCVPAGTRQSSQGQVDTWELADRSSTFTGPSACLQTRVRGFRRGKPKTPFLRILLRLKRK